MAGRHTKARRSALCYIPPIEPTKRAAKVAAAVVSGRSIPKARSHRIQLMA